MEHYNAVNCSDADFDGECDVAAVEGMIWAVAALVLVSLVIVALEVRRSIKRRRTT